MPARSEASIHDETIEMHGVQPGKAVVPNHIGGYFPHRPCLLRTVSPKSNLKCSKGYEHKLMVFPLPGHSGNFGRGRDLIEKRVYNVQYPVRSEWSCSRSW